MNALLDSPASQVNAPELKDVFSHLISSKRPPHPVAFEGSVDRQLKHGKAASVQIHFMGATPTDGVHKNIATWHPGDRVLVVHEGQGRLLNLSGMRSRDFGREYLYILMGTAPKQAALLDARKQAEALFERNGRSAHIWMGFRGGELVFFVRDLLDGSPGGNLSECQPIHVGKSGPEQAFHELLAIADRIEPLEAEWHHAFNMLGRTNKAGNEDYNDLVAAAARINAALEPYLDAIAACTGNSTVTLRQTMSPQDEISVYLGGSTSVPGFGPSHVLRQVAGYKSFNHEYWRSRGWMPPGKEKAAETSGVVRVSRKP